MSGDIESRRWVMVYEPISADIWAAVMEEPGKVRRSLDGSLTLLKFEGQTPAPLQGETVYTLAQIGEVLRGPEWADPEPEDPGS